jgi:hypothetical protein
VGQRTRIAVRAGVAVAAIGALSLAASPAQAQKPSQKPIGGGKLFVETATATPVAQNQVASATAECPPKTNAVAGGWATTPPFVVATLPNPAGHYLSVYESQMVGSDQWRVSAVQLQGNLDGLTAYVYCQSRKRLPTELATVSLPSALHGANEAEVECDVGKVLSGGFLTEPPSIANGAVVTASHRASKSAWAAAATRVAPNPTVPAVPPLTLTAFAYCAKVAPIRQRTQTVPVVGPQGASHVARPRNCQKRTKPRSGGFAVPHLTTGFTNAAVVHESRLAGNRWITAASATGSGTNTTVTSFQYCRS